MDYERGLQLPQLVSLLITPVVTGAVGYVTNYLAIKMLFRPHQPRWYSLGWQGVIPKKRKKLANEVGLMVGRDLISDKEIKGAIASENFQLLLDRAVSGELEKLLKKDYGNIYDIGMKLGIDLEKMVSNSLNKLLIDDIFVGRINSFINKEIKKIAEKFLSKSISDFDNFDSKIKSFIAGFMQDGNWQDIVVDEISASLNNVILSGKSLSDLLPESFDSKIEKLSEVITDKAIISIDKIMADPETREVIVEKLIIAKEDFFNSGLIDSIKSGFISMFLTDDMIAGVVNNELPKLIDNIKEQPEIREKIRKSIHAQISKMLEKPIYSFASTFGVDTLFEVRSNAVGGMKNYLKSDNFTEKISTIVSDTVNKYSHFTVGGILNTFGIKIDEKIDNLIDIRYILQDKDNHALFAEFGGSVLKRIQLSNLYEKVPEKSFDKMKVLFVFEINKILEKNISTTLKAIDLPIIVEDKINNLDLYEVENLLFSFMRDQFKWINILGFILGFLLGAVQSTIFFFMN